jgi:hypothetical protein
MLRFYKYHSQRLLNKEAYLQGFARAKVTPYSGFTTLDVFAPKSRQIGGSNSAVTGNTGT